MAQLLFALALSIALIAGVFYFWDTLWPLLPPWLSASVFIVVAVAAIGSPIYSLARWSDRKFQRYAKTDAGRDALRGDNNASYDDDD